jgi:hypothetical protein
MRAERRCLTALAMCLGIQVNGCGGRSGDTGEPPGDAAVLCALTLGVVDAADVVDKSELEVCASKYPNCTLVALTGGAVYRCCGVELYDADSGPTPNCMWTASDL